MKLWIEGGKKQDEKKDSRSFSSDAIDADCFNCNWKNKF